MPAFIACDHDSTANRIREVLSFDSKRPDALRVVSIESASQHIAREEQVDVVVLSLGSDMDRGLAVLPVLAKLAPGKVIVVGPTSGGGTILRALRCGAVDYVDTADLEVDLKSAIERMQKAAAPPVEPGKLVAVLGTSGGVGASTLTANLAVALGKGAKGVGVVDMKLESGDLTALFDLTATYTLADLCHNSAHLDRSMLERSLLKYEPNIFLLAPPQEIADVAHVRPEGVNQAITLARASFPFVVVDVDHSFRQEQRIVLQQADLILLVFRLDFTSLRSMRRTIEYLTKLGIPKERLRPVVNRYGQPQEVPASKAEEALGLKISHYIPEDAKVVNRANNRGVPVVVDAPSAKVSKVIVQIAAGVNGTAK